MTPRYENANVVTVLVNSDGVLPNSDEGLVRIKLALTAVYTVYTSISK